MSARRGAAARRRTPGATGLVAAAAGLSLVGFALGATAGLVWEAPGLVAAHLLGRGEEVPLAAAGDPGEAGLEASARPPLGARAEAAEEDLPAVAAEEGGSEGGEASEPAAPARRAAPVQGGFAVQVGAFAEGSSAHALAGRLRAAGFPVYVRRDGDEARHRVRVGPLASRAEAERVAGRLRRERDLPTWILVRERD